MHAQIADVYVISRRVIDVERPLNKQRTEAHIIPSVGQWSSL